MTHITFITCITYITDVAYNYSIVYEPFNLYHFITCTTYIKFNIKKLTLESV